MNTIELKKIIAQQELIPNILDKLGCSNIKKEQGGRIITASLPNGNNSRSVQVKNNQFLDATIRSKSITDIDIFDIVSYIFFDEKDKLGMKYARDMSINWVRKHLNVTKEDYIPNNFEWAYEVTNKVKKHTILDKSVLNWLLPFPHRDWLNEGISYETQKRFEISYNPIEHQITFPIYNENNELIGVKARNLTHTSDSSIPKYIYLNPFFVGGNLYGLNIAKNHIKESVIIFEAEKSVMKAYQYGYMNSVALACKELTNIQVDLLSTYINKDTNIILALDKDVYFKNGKLYKEEIKKMAKKYPNNKVYCLIDDKNLLKGKKDAPVDNGKEIFEQLLKDKKRIA